MLLESRVEQYSPRWQRKKKSSQTRQAVTIAASELELLASSCAA